MTDNEIVKALECCTTENGCCLDCPCWDYDEDKCAGFDHSDLFAFIKRQKEEIEVLAETLKATIAGQETLQRYIAAARADGIKEFAERLIGKAKSTKERFLLESLVESVKKEMGCNDESKT